MENLLCIERRINKGDSLKSASRTIVELLGKSRINEGDGKKNEKRERQDIVLIIQPSGS